MTTSVQYQKCKVRTAHFTEYILFKNKKKGAVLRNSKSVLLLLGLKALTESIVSTSCVLEMILPKYRATVWTCIMKQSQDGYQNSNYACTMFSFFSVSWDTEAQKLYCFVSLVIHSFNDNHYSTQHLITIFYVCFFISLFYSHTVHLSPVGGLKNLLPGSVFFSNFPC